MASELPSNLVITAFGLVFVVAGLYAMNLGRQERARSSAVAATETTAIRDLEAGPAEVKGTATVPDDVSPMSSPLTNEEALAAHVEVQEWESSGRGGNWQTIHEEEPAVPMLVDDGSGTVRVDLPSDGGLDLEMTRTKVESDEEPPDHVRQFVEDVPGLDIPDRQDFGPVSIGEPRRYAEGMIEPGAEVYVLGRAREAPDGAGGFGVVIDEPTPSGEFILSDKSEADLVREGTVGALIYFVVGGLVTLAGIATIAIPWVSP